MERNDKAGGAAATRRDGMGAIEEAPAKLNGGDIIAAVKQAGVKWVIAVPDLHTSHGLLHPISKDPDLRLIRVCKEDECLGIAAGLSYGDQRALILVQYTGFFYAMNAIRAVALEQKLPMCFMVGLLSKEVGVPPRQSKRLGIAIVEPVIDAIGMAQHYIDLPSDIPKIPAAIDNAYKTSRPVAMLIGRKPVAP
jgi:sulfopyruvate decarboxylase subunit alpha